MMLTNNQMHEGRFLRWGRARKKVAWVKAQLEAGKTVYVTTYTKCTKYKLKHIDMFKAARNGAFVQHGKRWDCFDGCDLRAFAE